MPSSQSTPASKSHAIVLFATAKDAANAIETFSNYSWNGQRLEVREDKSLHSILRPHEDRRLLTKAETTHPPIGITPNMKQTSALSSQFQNSPIFSHLDNQSSEKLHSEASRKQVYVCNLPYVVGWQDLKDLFREAGTVVRADIKHDPKTGKSRGNGIVLFSSSREAERAIAIFDNFEWFGRRIQVREDKSTRERAETHTEDNSAAGQIRISSKELINAEDISPLDLTSNSEFSLSETAHSLFGRSLAVGSEKYHHHGEDDHHHNNDLSPQFSMDMERISSTDSIPIAIPNRSSSITSYQDRDFLSSDYGSLLRPLHTSGLSPSSSSSSTTAYPYLRNNLPPSHHHNYQNLFGVPSSSLPDSGAVPISTSKSNLQKPMLAAGKESKMNLYGSSPIDEIDSFTRGRLRGTSFSAISSSASHFKPSPNAQWK